MSQIFAVFGSGLIKNNALLKVFLQSYLSKKIAKNAEENTVDIERIYPVISPVKPNTILLGWGRKKSYRRAFQFAQKHDLAMLSLEDGFLRSLASGKNSRYACSMVIDPVGIYFNAKYPSYLEQLITHTHLMDNHLQRSEKLIGRIIHERLSKYNTTAKSGTLSQLNIDNNKQNILLIDQVAGDQSISGAGADKDTFAKMLSSVQNNHPKAQIWIKAHPAGKVGYLTEIDLSNAVKVIRDHVNPIELLEQMDEVYTVSSHMGFEALMLGKKVNCFGVPWYAGWGVTDDSHAPQNVLAVAQARRFQIRQKSGLPPVTLNDLFFACYLQYSHYANPATGQVCDIEQAMDWLVTNRDFYQRMPDNFTIYDLSFWKYPFVRGFLATSGATLFFKPKFKLKTALDPKQLRFPKHHPFLVWGYAKKQQLLNKFGQHTQIWCMEDGFIRSNGLGANLIEPLSVVVDKTGIYYDATTPSDLESLLANQPQLAAEHFDRVKNLQSRLQSQQVSKYNVGKHKPLVLPEIANTKTKILVVGQVEDDMSVQRCTSQIKTNLGLLQAVREAEPTAFIIYKPHPDVQAGLRTGKIADRDMATFADQVVLDVSMPACLAVVDEVHTISSLTGFEALQRDKKVTCYGLPFYAGWGLTQDKDIGNTAQKTLDRRKLFREQHNLPALTLEQLICATLITYPLYRLPNGYLFKSWGLAQVEDVIDYLYPHPHLNSTNAIHATVSPKIFRQAKTVIKTQLTTKFMQFRHQLQTLPPKKR